MYVCVQMRSPGLVGVSCIMLYVCMCADALDMFGSPGLIGVGCFMLYVCVCADAPDMFGWRGLLYISGVPDVDFLGDTETPKYVCKYEMEMTKGISKMVKNN